MSFNSKQYFQDYFQSNYNDFNEKPCKYGVSLTIAGLVMAQEIDSVRDKDMLFRDDAGKILEFPNRKEAVRWIMNNVEEKEIDIGSKNFLLKNGWEKQYMKKGR